MGWAARKTQAIRAQTRFHGSTAADTTLLSEIPWASADQAAIPPVAMQPEPAVLVALFAHRAQCGVCDRPLAKAGRGDLPNPTIRHHGAEWLSERVQYMGLVDAADVPR